MLSQKQTLPFFERPPVVEVVFSVQFAPLSGLRAAHLGVLWDRHFRQGYPLTEEHPPLDKAVETFRVTPPAGDDLRLEFVPELPVPRLWFKTADSSELIQVQTDRFVHNWRRTGDGREYPRYDTLRPKFAQELATFVKFVEDERLGHVTPDQCEVTYINQVPIDAKRHPHAALGDALTVFQPHYSEPFPLELEDARLALRYWIPGKDDRPIGRLHVTMTPAYSRPERIPIFLMNLTARGGVPGRSVESALEFIDIGRECIVTAFAALTTKQMHELWGRQQ